MNMMETRRSITILSFAVLLAVSGCKTTETPIVGQSLDSLTGKHDETEDRMSTAAAEAVAEGKTQEALEMYEKLYKHPNAEFFTNANYRNTNIVLNYAQLLRKSGQPKKAAAIITPVVETRTGSLQSDVGPILLNEYAAINIELGKFDKAEAALNQVLEDEKAERFHADAENLLGIVLDAEGQHKEAEQSFRQALSKWKGDKTSVMNNLAVCLASQGMFDESIMTLREALIMSPKKSEIAHNIDLVTQLMQSTVAKAPKT